MEPAPNEPVVRLVNLGDAGLAERVAQRTEGCVAAYGGLVRALPQRPSRFAERPITDKKSYVQGASLRDLVGDDFESAFAIIASSGSSGRPVFWPQLRPPDDAGVERLRQYLEAAFSIRERRTLAIVGLALGSWIGGDFFSWILKNVAATSAYPFGVIATGNRHDEIISTIVAAASLVDQVLIFVCPSAIGHLHLLAETSGVAFPHERLRYVVLGEPFPETLRASLRAKGRMSEADTPILSLYGSADTGLLGAESPASAALRSLVHEHPRLGEQLGVRGAPHFFHNAAPDAFLEDVGSELIVTRWQGIPLVRYNLHDTTALLSWRGLRAGVLAWTDTMRSPHAAVIRAAGDDLPDLIAVSGRSDRCLILCGTNITEAMLDEAVAALDAPACTGVYRARVIFEDERQRLDMQLETRGAAPAEAEQREIYDRLVRALGRAQPEFLDDWQSIYRRWDDDAARRIIRISFVPWPSLSQRGATQIKNRGIVNE